MTRTILLADDSVTIQKVVELTFLDEDFRVVSFGNGSDAVARLAEIRPDVVLADVHMPGADGYELCAVARRELPNCPVLLLVGTFEVFDAEQAAASGAQGHLKKPFDSQELLRRVKDLIESASTGEAPAAERGGSDWSMSLETPEATPSPTEPSAVAAAEGVEVEQEDWSFEPIGEDGFEIAADHVQETSAVDALPPAIERAASFEMPRVESLEEEPQAMPAPAETMPAAVAPRAAAAEPLVTGLLADEDVDRIARRVVELLGDRIVRDVAWDVVPDLAEVLVKERIRELEASVE